MRTLNSWTCALLFLSIKSCLNVCTAASYHLLNSLLKRCILLEEMAISHQNVILHRNVQIRHKHNYITITWWLCLLKSA